MELLHDTHVWFAFSFIVFLLLAWRFGKAAILASLDKRIETIRREIETAENLRVEAQELLAQYQRKQRDALKDAENIIKTAKKSADEHRKESEAELRAVMERREKQLEERLARMEQSAIHEIQKHAAELAMDATARIIAEKLDKKSHERLVDQAIEGMSGKIN
jgi:F-type H+-transporting ATPase subunit b